jgi:hypothetical protein
VNTFSSRTVEVADRLAPGQLDDDGAPPAVTRHQAGGSHDRDAIRPGSDWAGGRKPGRRQHHRHHHGRPAASFHISPL